MRRLTFVSAVLLLLLGGALFGVDSGGETKGVLPFVDSDGTIHFPGRVRNDWVHLGSWGSADLNSADPGQHDVYTQPESLEAYRKTGKFPDGAVLVKEVRKIESAHMTTGPVTWAGAEVLWFVMIKDSTNRYAEKSPNWGEGWGWALFNVGETEKNASSNFRADCIACHVPARTTDWVYTQGYPSLKRTYE